MAKQDWLRNLPLRQTAKSVTVNLGTLYVSKGKGPWTLAGKPHNDEYELASELLLLFRRAKEEATKGG
jgi:hypothetical protein